MIRPPKWAASEALELGQSPVGRSRSESVAVLCWSAWGGTPDAKSVSHVLPEKCDPGATWGRQKREPGEPPGGDILKEILLLKEILPKKEILRDSYS